MWEITVVIGANPTCLPAHQNTNYLYNNKYMEKLVILQSTGIISSKETSVVTYTCRYSSEHLIADSS